MQGNGAGKYVSQLLKAICASYVKGLAPHTLCLSLPDRRTFIEDYLKIVGNGGVKTTRTYNEDPILSGYVLDLQKFEKLIRAGIKNGALSIEEKEIIGVYGKSFEL